MKSTIRISQCMIVKNEEKNIRRALMWGKNIVNEQIVVDTGSSDRTVEIAKEMGAKVFYFPWIGDFSAAKNYAIEQAKGDWILFLDADEYYISDDVNKITQILARLEQNFTSSTMPHIVRSNLVNLDDSGNPFSTGIQDRIFRNLPGLRYHNKIHEVLQGPMGAKLLVYNATKELSIFHTGYTSDVFNEGDKSKRNINLLKQEVRENPKNYNAWSYLGDSLLAAGKVDEAEEAYYRVINNVGKQITETRLNAAFCNLLKLMLLKHEKQEKDVLDIYQKARELKCVSFDAEYWVGRWMFQNGKEEQGVIYFEIALKGLEQCNDSDALYMSSALLSIYQTLFYANKTLESPAEMIKYGVLALRMNKYQEEILKEILFLLKKESGEEKNALATFNFLTKLYKMNSVKDKLFLVKVSKLALFPTLEDQVYEMFSLEERKLLNKKENSLYRVSVEEQLKEFPGFICKNEIDQEFLALIKELKSRPLIDLVLGFRKKFNELKAEHKEAANNYINCFSRFPFWGDLDPEKNQIEPLEQRIYKVQSRTEDFVWLYNNLGDYHSKKVLLSILKSWIYLDTDSLQVVKRGQKDYYDLDLVPSGEEYVFVDAGAYSGDTTRAYISAYGEIYKKIYCYEASSDISESLKRNIRDFDKINIRVLALDSCERESLLFFDEADPAISYLSETKGNIPVKTVSLDSSLSEKIDFLKIDVNGWEKRVLAGAHRHITEEHPCLLVALYHRFNDLAEVPYMIREMNQSYKLFLRYYGGDLIPTNFMLYAI